MKSGLSVHCHHDILVELCTDFNGRVNAIKRDKPIHEQEIRLEVFKMLSEEAIQALPKGLVKANADLDKANADRIKAYADRKKANTDLDKANADRIKAYADWDKAYADWNKANADLVKTYADWNKAYADWKGKEQWHKKFCGCKYWNGNELLF